MNGSPIIPSGNLAMFYSWLSFAVNNLDETDFGIPGNKIEFRKFEGKIQTRSVGETVWSNLELLISGTSPEDKELLTNIANNEFKIFYYSEINSNEGRITLPENATIQQDEFPGGVDALVNTIENGFPSGDNPQTVDGTPVDVSSFDEMGNYSLDGSPVSYPVAIIYILKVPNKYWHHLNPDYIIGTSGKFVESNYVRDIVKLTQAEYDALSNPSPAVLYAITLT